MVVRVPLTAAELRAAALPEAAELAELGLGGLWLGGLRALSLWFVKGTPYGLRLMPSELLLLPWMLPGPLLLIAQGAPAAIPALWCGGAWSLLSCLVWGLSFGTGDPSEW